MTKIEKPFYSKIEINSDSDGINIIIPQHQDVGIIIFIIGIINLILWTIFIDKIFAKDFFGFLFSIPFIVISFISLMIILYLLWQFRLKIDNSRITASYYLLNFVYDEGKYAIKDILEITEDIICEDYIEIIFKNSKKLRFRISNNAERKWLISTLYEIIKTEHIQTVDIVEANEDHKQFISKPYEIKETIDIQTDDAVKNNEIRKQSVSEPYKVTENSDIRKDDDTTDKPGKDYDLITLHTISYAEVLLIFSLFFLFRIVYIIFTKGFFNPDALGEIVLYAFLLALFGYGLYDMIFNRIHQITFSADDKKIVLKSCSKTKTVFVKDIKSLKLKGRKDPMCTLYTDSESITFPLFEEEFNEFVVRLKRNNDSFTLEKI